MLNLKKKSQQNVNLCEVNVFLSRKLGIIYPYGLR